MEMKYVQNDRVNEKLEGIIDELKEEIINRFHPKSIILSGSFGKGEATVIDKNSGELKFLSDCEIIIIPYKYIFNRRKIDEFELNFYRRTGLKINIWGWTQTFYLVLPFLNEKMKPTMINYDLKYGSKVIYGKNYLERIPNFKPEDIPLWEGIRLLFNRMAESLELFSLENPNEEMVFWTDKIVLACQDALLLCSGTYNSSFRIRNKIFEEVFQKNFVKLSEEFPNLLELAIDATNRKLNNNIIIKSPIEYWFNAAELCDKVFRYVIKKDMGIEFNDYLEFQNTYMKNPKIKKYHSEIVPSYVYQNLIALTKMAMRHDGFVSSRIITKMRTSWRHSIYSLIPLIYFSIPRDRKINEYNLNRAREVLSQFKKVEMPNKNGLEDFEYVKKEIINLWSAVC